MIIKTSHQALRLSIEQWETMIPTDESRFFETGKPEAYDRISKKYGIDHEPADCNCFLCMYGLQQIESDSEDRCTHCPISKAMAESGDPTDDCSMSCALEGSIYDNWHRNKTSGNSQAMINLFKQVLKEIS